MWSSLRERAEKRLNEVQKNATILASRAGTVLREAQDDDVDEGDDDLDVILGPGGGGGGDGGGGEGDRRWSSKQAETIVELQNEAHERRRRCERLEAELGELQERLHDAELRAASVADAPTGKAERDVDDSAADGADGVAARSAKEVALQTELRQLHERLQSAEQAKADADKRSSLLLRQKDDAVAALEQREAEQSSAMVPDNDSDASVSFERHPPLESVGTLLHGRQSSEDVERWLLHNKEQVRRRVKAHRVDLPESADEASALLDALLRLSELGADDAEVRTDGANEAAKWKARVGELEARVEKEQDRLSALSATHDESRRAEERLSAELSSARSAAEDRLQKSQQECGRLRAECEELLAASAEAERKKAAVAQSAEDADRLDTRRSAELAEREAEIRRLKGNVAELEDEAQKLRDRLRAREDESRSPRPSADADDLDEVGTEPSDTDKKKQLREERAALTARVEELDALVYELRDECRSLHDELDRSQQADAHNSELERQQATRDEQRATALDAQGAQLREDAAAARKEAQRLTAALTRSESELQHATVALQNTRRQYAELEDLVDVLERERDHLRRQTVAGDEAQQSQAADLRSLDERVQRERTARQRAEAEADSARRAMQEMERREVEMAHARASAEQLYESVAVDADTALKRIDELHAELRAATARASEAHERSFYLKQEADMARDMSSNMQRVLEDFQASREADIEQRLQALRAELNTRAGRLERLESQERTAHQKAEQLLSELREKDEAMLARTTELAKAKEHNMELKAEMERLLSGLHSSVEDELIDRRVIKQLLVTYFAQGVKRRRDVMELMSRILNFDEKEMVQVGLRRRGLQSVLGSLMRQPQDGSDSAESVSDKWVEFLMKETEENDEQNGGAAAYDDDT